MPDPADGPLSISDLSQVTLFVDVEGRLHVYEGAGIVDMRRLEGIDRAVALDLVRAALDADYHRALSERTVPNA